VKSKLYLLIASDIDPEMAQILELPDNVFNVDITKMLKVLNYLAFPPL
jgi:hypothetical protein